MKICTKCNTAKPFAHFSKHAKVQYQPWCKSCCSQHRKLKLQNSEYKAARNFAIREYHRSDTLFALKNKMRRMVRRTINKSSPASSMLGYNAQELKQHLESKFDQGMSWKNRHEWHIDHIIPIANFIERGIIDPKIINALSNLQPLWAEENLAKGTKV